VKQLPSAAVNLLSYRLLRAGVISWFVRERFKQRSCAGETDEVLLAELRELEARLGRREA
jgi:hypothetical protein